MTRSCPQALAAQGGRALDVAMIKNNLVLFSNSNPVALLPLFRVQETTSVEATRRCRERLETLLFDKKPGRSQTIHGFPLSVPRIHTWQRTTPRNALLEKVRCSTCHRKEVHLPFFFPLIPPTLSAKHLVLPFPTGLASSIPYEFLFFLAVSMNRSSVLKTLPIVFSVFLLVHLLRMPDDDSSNKKAKGPPTDSSGELEANPCPTPNMEGCCPICYEPLPDMEIPDIITNRNAFRDNRPPTAVRLLCAPVNHIYHSECIGKWFYSPLRVLDRPNCPMCRQHVQKDEWYTLREWYGHFRINRSIAPGRVRRGGIGGGGFGGQGRMGEEYRPENSQQRVSLREIHQQYQQQQEELQAQLQYAQQQAQQRAQLFHQATATIDSELIRQRMERAQYVERAAGLDPPTPHYLEIAIRDARSGQVRISEDIRRPEETHPTYMDARRVAISQSPSEAPPEPFVLDDVNLDLVEAAMWGGDDEPEVNMIETVIPIPGGFGSIFRNNDQENAAVSQDPTPDVQAEPQNNCDGNTES
ncbi:hypothetical protein MKZ38_010633 [Zalerion maritima]|uniref:RING-type domain-containing protein n=1 Tax=Zalerion maritima TaxID=339359 RepID=A0AAD5RFC2_9PEZI|nr:hypothetical protein MKZ38_010633 [Zalerion maritima]